MVRDAMLISGVLLVSFSSCAIVDELSYQQCIDGARSFSVHMPWQSYRMPFHASGDCDRPGMYRKEWAARVFGQTQSHAVDTGALP